MNSKIKCLILDDELPGLTYLKMLCEQLPYVEVVRCFNSPTQFLKEHQSLNFDLCLLDVNMPDINGIEIASLLKGKPVIFTSAHPEFAIQAYELEALDFIRKPVTQERLEKALLKARKLILEKDSLKSFFTWNSNIGRSAIFFEEVLYITTSEIDKRDKLVYLQNNNQLILKNITIEKLLSLLPKKDFIQINKSDIITAKAIQAYTADEIVLKTPGKVKTLNIGDSFKKNFTAWIA
jgi:two-component system, LytTR family, response regulator